MTMGRLVRPVLDDKVCRTCMVCQGGCPAAVIPAFRREEKSLRGRVYSKHFGGKIEDKALSNREKTFPMAPCQEACPIHQDARGYIGMMAEKRFDEAVGIIRQVNALPGVTGYVCHHPCEAACVRNVVDEPVSIRGLKRFAAAREKRPQPQAAPTGGNGARVAVVGSGPAGLATAHDLAAAGYRVELFEAESAPGGMLRWAIPAFRLPRDILDRDISYLERMGVKIHTGVRLGTGKKLADLKNDFAAVVIATGTQRSLKMQVPGEDANSIDCLTFLKDFSEGRPPRLGQKVIVVGGGNAAIDAARSALRCGIKECTIVYRRSRNEMPADEEEVKEAQGEGVNFVFLASPVRFMTVDGRRGIEFIKNRLGKADSSGRRRPVPVAGSEFVLEADTVISAVGQEPDTSWATDTPLRFNSDSTFDVDDSLMTGVEGVFAAGDSVNGPTTVVEAMASGKKAAAAVDAYLSGKARGKHGG